MKKEELKELQESIKKAVYDGIIQAADYITADRVNLIKEIACAYEIPTSMLTIHGDKLKAAMKVCGDKLNNLMSMDKLSLVISGKAIYPWEDTRKPQPTDSMKRSVELKFKDIKDFKGDHNEAVIVQDVYGVTGYGVWDKEFDSKGGVLLSKFSNHMKGRIQRIVSIVDVVEALKESTSNSSDYNIPDEVKEVANKCDVTEKELDAVIKEIQGNSQRKITEEKNTYEPMRQQVADCIGKYEKELSKALHAFYKKILEDPCLISTAFVKFTSEHTKLKMQNDKDLNSIFNKYDVRLKAPLTTGELVTGDSVFSRRDPEHGTKYPEDLHLIDVYHTLVPKEQMYGHRVAIGGIKREHLELLNTLLKYGINSKEVFNNITNISPEKKKYTKEELKTVLKHFQNAEPIVSQEISEQVILKSRRLWIKKRLNKIEKACVLKMRVGLTMPKELIAERKQLKKEISEY